MKSVFLIFLHGPYTFSFNFLNISRLDSNRWQVAFKGSITLKPKYSLRFKRVRMAIFLYKHFFFKFYWRLLFSFFLSSFPFIYFFVSFASLSMSVTHVLSKQFGVINNDTTDLQLFGFPATCYMTQRATCSSYSFPAMSRVFWFYFSHNAIQITSHHVRFAGLHFYSTRDRRNATMACEIHVPPLKVRLYLKNERILIMQLTGRNNES